jgi:hypothetical protein
MNMLTEKGREVLVEAALRGHPQSKGQLHSDTGDCALGVLHRHYHQEMGTETDRKLRWCHQPIDELVNAEYLTPFSGKVTCVVCGDRPRTLHPVAHYNDVHEWDFLTIACKL